MREVDAAEPEEVPDIVALYVPGNRPARFDTALSSGADVIIVDLEDAVPDDAKAAARASARRWLEDLSEDDRRRVSLRVNTVGTARGDADLAALVGLSGIHSVRVPKVQSLQDITHVVSLLEDARVVALVETARGIEDAASIAESPHVVGVALGEADLRSDLGIFSDEGLSWCRARIVVAARAAGLPPPMMSVWTDLADTEGLVASCRAGRALGFLGRTAVHPSQVEPIRQGFLPSAEEVSAAKETLAVLEKASWEGAGVAVLGSGRMVDSAMVGAARRVLALHAQLTA